MHVVQGMPKSRRVLRTQIFWAQMPQMCGYSTTQQRTVRETQPFSVIGPGGGRALGDAPDKTYMLATSLAETLSS